MPHSAKQKATTIKGPVCFLGHETKERSASIHGGCNCWWLLFLILISFDRLSRSDPTSRKGYTLTTTLHSLHNNLQQWSPIIPSPPCLTRKATMSYYAQPATANYNTAPLHNQRQRGYRICDQCGTVETPAVKFRLCGGCVRSSCALHTDIVTNEDPFIMFRWQHNTVYVLIDDPNTISLLTQFFFFSVTRLSKDSLAIP